eukprot:CAMPEP_0117450268 /NCGR_PEP_ID=MMETSP0759-20121206/8378_1 /TAXON_ID=63605 /ORGANISM="Percolomonas cosmopolitus, Strain WS" /LENGTH=378 /DNA_ID=CAMNT_0005242779 /DNA_START=136 /DNA_END=1272 /DNA_ORIENTATION=-
MLFTGTINTVATKFQDLQIVKGTGRGPPTKFEHPFLQTAIMFVGEYACLFAHYLSVLIVSGVYKLRQKKSEEDFKDIVEEQTAKKPVQEHANPLVFWIPAICDLSGTTLLNIGLFFTYASVYQMLRGSVVIFNAIFACIFLKQRLGFHHWFGIVLIVAGLTTVGLSSVLYTSSGSAGARNPLLGDALVVVACILQAVQFVVEEKFVAKYDAAPLECVGWEGFFGLSMTLVFLFVLYFIPGSDAHSLENGAYAFAQMARSPILMISVVGSATSIAFFNFIGITITKRVSSTTRSTIDACRTMFIWVVSLVLGWEDFRFLQLGGFAVLVTGTFLYNGVIRIPIYHGWYVRKQYEKAQIKAFEDAVDNTFAQVENEQDAGF